MRKFALLILQMTAMSLLVMVIFDYVYTSTYSHAFPRTKFQYLRSLENKRIDFIFLGSSRVENTIVPKLIIDKTGKSALNLGFQAARMSDIYVLLKLIKEYNIKTEKILIQVDYIFNIEEEYSNLLPYQIMPFIKENQATKDYFNLHFINKKELYYIPFYRYGIFESKIGFREFFLNGIHKKTPITENYGFYGLEGNTTNFDESLPGNISQGNSYLNKIKAYAMDNDMEIQFFCAPFSKKTKNLDYIKKLKQKIPELYDFSQAISDDTMFQNAYHLNKEGAYYFTEELINRMIQ